jgi:hypothetical protein
VQTVDASDRLEESDVPQNEIGFRCDGQAPALLAGEYLENLAGQAEPPLRGLVRIGRGADRDGLAERNAAKLGAEGGGGEAFRVDEVLKRLRSELHELVRVAGVAVLAGELAAAVRVDGPAERHALSGAVEETASGEVEVFDRALGFEEFAGGGQAGNADEFRQGLIGEQHTAIFAFYSHPVKASKSFQRRGHGGAEIAERASGLYPRTTRRRRLLVRPGRRFRRGE